MSRLRIASNVARIIRSDEWRDIKRVLWVEEQQKAKGEEVLEEVMEGLEEDLRVFLDEASEKKA